MLKSKSSEKCKVSNCGGLEREKKGHVRLNVLCLQGHQQGISLQTRQLIMRDESGATCLSVCLVLSIDINILLV